MIETIHYCDSGIHDQAKELGNKKRLAVIQGIHVHVGTSSQGSGSSENMYQVVDLCDFCAKGLIQSLFNDLRGIDISNLQILKRWKIKEHADI